MFDDKTGVETHIKEIESHAQLTHYHQLVAKIMGKTAIWAISCSYPPSTS